MPWHPDMTEDERRKLNASRRRSYARKRLKAGKEYRPKIQIPDLLGVDGTVRKILRNIINEIEEEKK